LTQKIKALRKETHLAETDASSQASNRPPSPKGSSLPLQIQRDDVALCNRRMRVKKLKLDVYWHQFNKYVSERVRAYGGLGSHISLALFSLLPSITGRHRHRQKAECSSVVVHSRWWLGHGAQAVSLDTAHLPSGQGWLVGGDDQLSTMLDARRTYRA